MGLPFVFGVSRVPEGIRTGSLPLPSTAPPLVLSLLGVLGVLRDVSGQNRFGREQTWGL